MYEISRTHILKQFKQFVPHKKIPNCPQTLFISSVIRGQSRGTDHSPSSWLQQCVQLCDQSMQLALVHWTPLYQKNFVSTPVCNTQHHWNGKPDSTTLLQKLRHFNMFGTYVPVWFSSQAVWTGLHDQAHGSYMHLCAVQHLTAFWPPWENLQTTPQKYDGRDSNSREAPCGKRSNRGMGHVRMVKLTF